MIQLNSLPVHPKMVTFCKPASSSAPVLILVSITVIFSCTHLCQGHQRTDSDIFSSTTELLKLSKYEEEVVETLQEYAEVLDQNLKTIRKYVLLSFACIFLVFRVFFRELNTMDLKLYLRVVLSS